MKFYLPLLALTTTLAFAAPQQGEERDFGDLLPEDHFSIKNAKTTLKDNADIKNYQIKSSPKKDEFTYKVDNVKTPKGSWFAKRPEFKLEVEREEGKVTRFSSVSFTNGDEAGNVHQVSSTSILPSGYVNSHTNCYEEYQRGFLGIKKNRSGFKCVTVTAAVCEYLAKNEVDSAMVEKINSCSDVLGKLSSHQDHLYDLSKYDHKKDLSALGKINGKLSDAKNFYELKGSTLKDVSEIVSGYGSALSQCEFLKEKNYLAPKEEPNEENQESSTSGSKEE